MKEAKILSTDWLKAIPGEKTIEVLCHAAWQLGLPLALWRLPVKNTQHLLIDLSGKAEGLDIQQPDLESLPPGFLFTPYEADLSAPQADNHITQGGGKNQHETIHGYNDIDKEKEKGNEKVQVLDKEKLVDKEKAKEQEQNQEQEEGSSRATGLFLKAQVLLSVEIDLANIPTTQSNPAALINLAAHTNPVASSKDSMPAHEAEGLRTNEPCDASAPNGADTGRGKFTITEDLQQGFAAGFRVALYIAPELDNREKEMAGRLLALAQNILEAKNSPEHSTQKSAEHSDQYSTAYASQHTTEHPSKEPTEQPAQDYDQHACQHSSQHLKQHPTVGQAQGQESLLQGAKLPYFIDSSVVASNTSKDYYCLLVERAMEQIRQGKLQKVVCARSKTLPIHEGFDPLRLFQRLSSAYPNAFVSLVSIKGKGTWMGASPETIISIDQKKIFRTMSLAGTQAKAAETSPSEAVWRQKEIEEQALVSRYIINCFKKIRLREFDEIGPRTVVAGNLMHLRTDFLVNMQETDFMNLGTVMLSMLHPTSAVCGMPRAMAKTFLEEHEGLKRAFFAGFLGPINLQKETNLFVNLRCMQLLKNELILYAGAGITGDSKPEKEWEETEQKCATLAELLMD